MKQIIKDALILFAITAVAGVLLAFVNEITKEPIAAQEQQKKTEAFQAVFADAVTFEAVALPDMTAPEYVPFAEAHPLSEINEINIAYDAAGQLAGYVLTVTNKEGYGGNIQFVMGLRMNGTLNGISILETSETVGLGLEAQTVLAPQFAGRNVTSFTYTKTGAMAESEVAVIATTEFTLSAQLAPGKSAGSSKRTDS